MKDPTELLKKMAAMEKVAVRYLSAISTCPPTDTERRKLFRQHVRDLMKGGAK
jgi:hypothetical protein